MHSFTHIKPDTAIDTDRVVFPLKKRRIHPSVSFSSSSIRAIVASQGLNCHAAEGISLGPGGAEKGGQKRGEGGRHALFSNCDGPTLLTQTRQSRANKLGQFQLCWEQLGRGGAKKYLGVFVFQSTLLLVNVRPCWHMTSYLHMCHSTPCTAARVFAPAGLSQKSLNSDAGTQYWLDNSLSRDDTDWFHQQQGNKCVTKLLKVSTLDLDHGQKHWYGGADGDTNLLYGDWDPRCRKKRSQDFQIRCRHAPHLLLLRNGLDGAVDDVLEDRGRRLRRR